MRFVFLIYVSRSGSTLFARHLARARAGVLVVPESRVFERVLSLDEAELAALGPAGLADVLAVDERDDPLRPTCEELETVWPQVRAGGMRALLEALIGIHAGRERISGFDAAVLKWGQIVRLRHRLKQLAPDSAFIHVYRDPRGVANSMLNSRRPYFRGEQMGRGDPVFIGRSWAAFQKTVTAMQEEGWPLSEVRYESFCARPEATIDRVSAELELGSHDGTTSAHYEVAAAEADIHKLVDKPPSADRVDAWKTEVPRYVTLAVERAAGAEMTRRGYEPSATTAVQRLAAMPPATLRHWWKTAIYFWRRIWYYLSRPRFAIDRWRLMRARLRG